MPELPDVTVYVEHLRRRLVGEALLAALPKNPFLLRTVEPPLDALRGKRVVAVERLGKRIVLSFEDDLHLILHLMIAGRLQWKAKAANLVARFEFTSGTLLLTEAGTKKRASLHVVRGAAGVREHDRGGVEPLVADQATFDAALRRENHTLKRTLTDPRLFSGIGNAYSDEILHRARLSPMQLSSRLGDEESRRLHAATQEVLREWTERLRAEAGHEFPSRVTAFHDGMAVHGRYRLPCPVCGTPVQRIRYADNECNYCPTCQTGGRLLADRALSRLLREDWPRSLEEMEERKARHG